MIFVILCALGVLFSHAASAEVRKPVRPKFRIVQGSPDAAPNNPVSSSSRDNKSNASSVWDIISNTNDIAVLDRFIAQFPDSYQASLAVRRRKQLLNSAPLVKDDRDSVPARVIPTSNSNSLALDIQTELQRLGCAPGRPDGEWGRQSIRAAKRFVKYASIGVETNLPNSALLASVLDSKAGICPAKRAKTCGRGQKLSSMGRCYTPKTAKTCKRGERLSSRGICFVPKARVAKVSTPRRVQKPKPNRCSWCGSRNGAEHYVCGNARIAKLRASGNCS